MSEGNWYSNLVGSELDRGDDVGIDETLDLKQQETSLERRLLVRDSIGVTLVSGVYQQGRRGNAGS